jgi:hypothetical protein
MSPAVRRIVLTLAVLVAGVILPATSTLAGSTPAWASTASAPAAAGRIGIRLLEIPADAADDPRARIYVTDHLNPGSVIHRRISVSNLSDTPRDLRVYAGAASIEHGDFKVAAGDTPNELTTWITVDHPSLSLRPQTAATVTVTVAVPRDASPGEHYAAIWAETAEQHTAAQQNVLEVSRVGIRVYLSVGPGGSPPADFTVSALSSHRLPDGRTLVAALVRNTGGRALDLTGQLTLAHGPSGLNAGPVPALLGRTLAPGQSEPVTATLDKVLPGGRWTAQFDIKSGVTSRIGGAIVTVPRSSDESTLGNSHSSWIRGHLAAGAIGVLLLMMLLSLALYVRRRSSSSRGQLKT